LNYFVVDHLDELVNRRNVSGERHLQPALGSAFPRAVLGAASAVLQGVVHSGTRERDSDARHGTQTYSVIAPLSRVCTPK
jgi:hypothetical protein